MHFPCKFSRWKGAGAPADAIVLGSDVAPTAYADLRRDSVLNYRPANASGFPAQRVAIVYSPPSGSTSLIATLYAYEANTGKWYRVGPASFTLTPGKITYVDALGLLEPPATQANIANASPSGVQMCIVVADNAAPDGEHVFALAPDITNTEGVDDAGAEAAATDTDANDVVAAERSRMMSFNGTTWERVRSALSNVVAAVVTVWTGIIHVLMFGRYVAARPVLTDGQGTHMHVTQSGDLSVAERNIPDYEDGQWDVAAVAIRPVPDTTYATSVLTTDFGATVTKNAKATKGVVTGLILANRNAAVRYLQLHNTATTPSGGAVPFLSIPVAPTGATGFKEIGNNVLGLMGVCPGASGIAYAWSTTSGTYTAATASEHDTIVLGK